MGDRPAQFWESQTNQLPRSPLLQGLAHLLPSARRVGSQELVPSGGWAWIPQLLLESTIPSEPSQQRQEGHWKLVLEQMVW